MRIDVITIFPEYLAPLGLSLIGKARQAGLLEVVVHDLRTFTDDRHRTVDDTPYGGGPGMVMTPEPWGRALDAVVTAGASGGRGGGVGEELAVPRLIVPTPAGRPFRQADAERLAGSPWLAFACGRYEGIDQRVVDEARDRMPVEEVSIGDYVLAGGEAAVLVIVEAVARLLPGVLGNEASAADDSHSHGLLEGPVYTKPPVWRGRAVPEVLRSGDHAAVARWRAEQSLARTRLHRPDLLPAEPDPAAVPGAGFGPEQPPVAD